MPFVETDDLEAGSVLDADVCVIGAGPAGLAVATEVAGGGHRVVVLEAGGRRADSSGHRFGGTAWYGRCAMLDPIDFEARAWVAGSGWPIPAEELTTRYARAARFLGLPRPEALTTAFWDDDAGRPALEQAGLAPVAHLMTPARDLGEAHASSVATSARVDVVLHATAVGLEVADGRPAVAGVCVRARNGRGFSCRARHFVLACGGLENARMLLELASDRPGFLGACAGAVGRFYMNHARTDGVARLRLDPAHPGARRWFGRLTECDDRRSGCRAQLAIALAGDTQRQERLLNACAFFYPATGASAALRVQTGLARLGVTPPALDHLVMVEQLEQAPDAESRIILRETRDRDGRRTIEIASRVGPETQRTQRRLHERLAVHFRALRLGTLSSPFLEDPEFVPDYGDAAHPMGATRMSRDPQRGVVDPDAGVHGVTNLHVAGSSIFPTGGHANPTLPLVALSFRLGEHLRAALRS